MVSLSSSHSVKGTNKMQQGKFNVLMDLQWGSCGKGKVMPWLVRERGVGAVSSSNRPNAGHTARVAGRDYVFKVLPSGAVIPDTMVFLSPSVAYWPEQLEKELRMCNWPVTFIHELAQRLCDDDVTEEKMGLRQISSTLQGAGSSYMRKLERASRAYATLTDKFAYSPEEFAALARAACHKSTMLHECSQGWALSLDYGRSYPYVTSRNCGVAAALDQMGIPPSLLGDVYGVFRPYPIRVGNLADSFSGPTYEDSHEITWEEVTRASGAPHSLQELTTVTERVRRVFTFSDVGMRHAIECNGVTKLILNFAQQLDWKQYQDREQMTARVGAFVARVEDTFNVPVVAVGTGPDIDDMVVL